MKKLQCEVLDAVYVPDPSLPELARFPYKNEELPQNVFPEFLLYVNAARRMIRHPVVVFPCSKFLRCHCSARFGGGNPWGIPFDP
jgi:hypothetical protein